MNYSSDKGVNRAGLVPFYWNEEKQKFEMMFMKPSNALYGGPDFQICKGKIEDNETPRETAIREAEEELGLPPSLILAVYDCGVWLGRTQFFTAVVSSKESYLPWDEETGAVDWMTLEEFQDIGRDIHVPVVESMHGLTSCLWEMHLFNTEPVLESV